MSKTLYYKISVSGPVQMENAPKQQPLLVNGVKVDDLYNSHQTSGSVWQVFTQKVDAVSFTRPPDLRTATFVEVFPWGSTKTESWTRQAWHVASVPDDWVPPAGVLNETKAAPPDPDRTDTGDSGGGGGGWGLGPDGISVRDVKILDSAEYAGIQASVGDGIVDLLTNNAPKLLGGFSGLPNLGTQLKNALNVKALLTKVQTDQLAVVEAGVKNFGSANPTMTDEQFAAFADRTMAQSQIDGLKALENHTFLPGNPAAEAAADRVAASGRVLAEIVGGQGANIKVNVEVEFGGLTVNLFAGTINADIMVAGNSGPRVEAGAGNDTVLGGSGMDRLVGEAGDDFLYGGAGTDTAEYSGVRRSYTAAPDRVSGPEGNDRLLNVERIEFVDGDLVSDPGAASAQVYRIYGATLGRAPDNAGLRAWTDAVEHGTPLQAIVTGFVGSPEFTAKYGNTDSAAFVGLLYRNVLGRDGDPAGVQHWTGVLNNGTSRPDVVLGFSEAAEYVGKTRGEVTKGLWVGDQQAAIAARVYDTTLDRRPDAAGLKFWADYLDGGGTAKAMVDGFTGSPEFQSKYGTLDNSGFLTLLYRNVLDREPEPLGFKNWTTVMAGGTTRAEVVLAFSESPEHVAKMAPVIDDGIWIV